MKQTQNNLEKICPNCGEVIDVWENSCEYCGFKYLNINEDKKEKAESCYILTSAIIILLVLYFVVRVYY